MKENDNMTALEVYDTVKPQGHLEVPVRVNISGYADKVGPDVFGREKRGFGYESAASGREIDRRYVSSVGDRRGA